jgi:hypothetical protein
MNQMVALLAIGMGMVSKLRREKLQGRLMQPFVEGLTRFLPPPLAPHPWPPCATDSGDRVR